jgi:epoxyqueuosine reductase
VDKRVNPAKILADARSIVVVGLNYYTGDHERTGRIARYGWGTRDYHNVMSEKLEHLSESITEIGGPGIRCLGYVDTGPILERDLAQRAGIGFIGKHTNLISRQLGNWLFVGEILTNLELSPDPPEREYCGTCQRCMDVCTTRAIVHQLSDD